MTPVCSFHREHDPRPAYLEAHHVIPQAWQALWRPATARAAGLWDPRTVAVCATGHRNIHFYLMRIVRTFYAILLEGGGPIQGDCYESALIAGMGDADLPVHGHRAEIDCAFLGLQRWYDAGGLVRPLGDAGEWGEA